MGTTSVPDSLTSWRSKTGNKIPIDSKGDLNDLNQSVKEWSFSDLNEFQLDGGIDALVGALSSAK